MWCRDVLLPFLRQPQLPKCHTAQTREWLEHRQAEMLPVPYFHITVTVPAELRAPLRAHQRDGYAVLMQATAAAIIEIARDPRFVGGTVAVLAVLHTWDQRLDLHPHVHCLVSGGGLSAPPCPPSRRSPHHSRKQRCRRPTQSRPRRPPGRRSNPGSASGVTTDG